ncbi:MAG: hypothetical protein V5A48_05080 [Salinivenus sp.]
MQEQMPASPEAPDSFRPIDHAKMVLTPVLLILAAVSLFFGPGSPLETVAPAAVLAVFAILSGEQLYRTWTAIS